MALDRIEREYLKAETKYIKTFGEEPPKMQIDPTDSRTPGILRQAIAKKDKTIIDRLRPSDALT